MKKLFKLLLNETKPGEIKSFMVTINKEDNIIKLNAEDMFEPTFSKTYILDDKFNLILIDEVEFVSDL